MVPKEQFKELDLSNAFLFSLALSDPEICAMILKMILERPVGEVTVQPEKSILFSAEFRSVRLDVYASEGMQVDYDLEMQNQNLGNLPLRSRLYQAEMDASALKPGEDFNCLRPSYVIFICTFDPFGEGLYRYIFENRCLETGKPLGDGTRKIFLNTRGTRPEGVPPELIHFLEYLENSTDECVERTKDEAIAKIHSRVVRLKEDRRWEAKYMKFEELLQDKLKEGVVQGRQEGISLTKRVYQLAAAGVEIPDIASQCDITEAEAAAILAPEE